MARHFILPTLFILLSNSAHAVDQNWVNQSDFTKRTTGYSLSTRKIRINAEVIDFNTSSTQKRPGLDQFRAVLTKPLSFNGQFQAEVQGARAQEGEEFANLNSYLRHRNELVKTDIATVSLQAQLFTTNLDSRPAIGIPIDFRITKKDFVGFSGMIEQGKYVGDGEALKKYMVNMYYNRNLFQGLFAGLGLYSEQLSGNDSKKYSTLNATVNCQFKNGARVNVGSYASKTAQDEIVYNHVLGWTFVF